jgi:hypothetical protein
MLIYILFLSEYIMSRAVTQFRFIENNEAKAHIFGFILKTVH